MRGIAVLITELKLPPSEAALLIHAGLSTPKAIASATPQEIVQKTGRLERQLRTGRDPIVDLVKANYWIRLAKNRQILN